MNLLKMENKWKFLVSKSTVLEIKNIIDTLGKMAEE